MGEISWPTHTIRPKLKVGVFCLPSLSWGVGGVGVSVRAQGLCDISRLPIWLGEWTPSNYSCSYCLINLPVSLLHPTPPPPDTHYLFFFHYLLQRSRLKRRKKIIEWQDNHKTATEFLESQWENPEQW